MAGVDLGIAALATVSDGMVVENPRALRRDLAKLRQRQRCVSRRQKGSANRAKAIKQLAQAHRRVANVRQNALHQATSRLARTKSVVVLEDLNVRGMLQNHHLAQAIADVGMAEFRRQIDLQRRLVWLRRRRRRSLLPLDQALFVVRPRQDRDGLGRAHVHL